LDRGDGREQSGGDPDELQEADAGEGGEEVVQHFDLGLKGGVAAVQLYGAF
jgi:hypothetical protein